MKRLRVGMGREKVSGDVVRRVGMWVCVALLLGGIGCQAPPEDPSSRVNGGEKSQVDLPGTTNEPAERDEIPASPLPVNPDPGPQEEFPSGDPPEQEFPDIVVATKIELKSVFPTFGEVAGGTKVILSGSLFTPQTEVYFGTQRGDFQLVGDQLVGVTPPGGEKRGGVVNVRLFDPRHGTYNLADAFTYFQPVRVEEVRPRRLSVDGGERVVIRGSGFSPTTSVAFGESEALSLEFVDSETIVATTPPLAAASRYGRPGVTQPLVQVPLVVTTRYEVASVNNVVEYYTPAKITTVTPAQGESSGGESVTIQGAGFDSQTRVTFGGELGNVERVAPDGGELVVTAPAHKEGFVNIVVATSVDHAIAPNAFYYIDPLQPTPAPTLQHLSPTTALVTGGGKARLTGVAIEDPRGEVYFGDQAAPILARGAGYVVVEVPAVSAPKRVEVRFEIPATETPLKVVAPLAQPFEYIAESTITTLTPKLGSSDGNEKVVVKGTHFNDISALRVGGVPTPFTILDDETIEFTTLPHPPGVVSLVLEKGGITFEKENAYTFQEELELYSVTPNSGLVAGDATFEILGRGFSSDSVVTFDGLPATSVKVIASNRITGKTPAHAAGLVDVVVKKIQESKGLAKAYRYVDALSQGGGTSGGPIDGELNVTVYSSNGPPVKNAFVTLSTRRETPYYGLTNANGFLSLVGADLVGEQTVNVSAYGYSSTSIQSFNSKNVTILLDLLPNYREMPDGRVLHISELPPPEEGDPPLDGGGGSQGGDPGAKNPTAPLPEPVVQGTLNGLEKLGFPERDEVLRAYIFTTQRTKNVENPDPGPRSVLSKSGRYAITTRIGDFAVIALGGLYNLRTGAFTPLAMGIKRYVTASRGGVYDIDLNLNIPLETTMRVKIDAAPATTPYKMVFPWINLGYEGVFHLKQFPVSTSSVVEVPHQPDIARHLPGATYSIEAGAYRYENRYSTPRSVSFLDGITDQKEVITMPGLYALAGIANESDIQFGVGYGKTVNLTLDSALNPPDLFKVSIISGELGKVWEIFLPGDQRSFQLPDLPQAPGIDTQHQPNPYPPGEYHMLITGVKLANFDYGNVNLSRLTSQPGIVGYSRGLYSIRFSLY